MIPLLIDYTQKTIPTENYQASCYREAGITFEVLFILLFGIINHAKKLFDSDRIFRKSIFIDKADSKTSFLQKTLSAVRKKESNEQQLADIVY